MMNTTVILPAAGLGSRFAVGDRASASKIEFELRHKPVFLRTIDLFHGRADVGQIILAVHPGRLDDFKFRWADQLGFLGVKLIAGGEAERWETVQLALKHIADDATHIAVHDAARPCTSTAMIDRVFGAAEKLGAALPGLPMGDTVKRAGAADTSNLGKDLLDAIFDRPMSPTASARPILETVPRHDLCRVQTPQVFERQLISDAYAAISGENSEGITDDASAAERAGHEVYIVEGDPLNMKLTHPADAELLEAVLAMREEKAAKDSAIKQLFGDDDDD
ncbi:MAG: 2-C-methyl-D-erythritol 4-phosphate cytidylyltransferase [Firmicutes bacterium]|nr:2-C-methyl-D-erythritol 4-phosphate cytidylyltransferase [Bacillota bacterium]